MRALPTFASARPLLPQPFWPGHESAIACYWKVWEIAFRNLKQPTPQNGFVSPYIDTAFNGNLFMWDSAFILMFCRYARRAFNFQQTLDNLYCKQHPDGFICREIRESDGSDCFKRFDPPATGPDVMGWSEWEYYVNFGDKERLAKVFPALLAYHQWMRRYRTWQDGTYWATGWACGMDNQPRLLGPVGDGPNEWWNHDHMTWVDTCFQAAFSAQVLIRMAGELSLTPSPSPEGRWELPPSPFGGGAGGEGWGECIVADLHAEIARLSQAINATMWDEARGFYFDRRADGSLSSVKTIGAFWALLGGITPPERLARLVDHLNAPGEFNRPHRVPTLSADDPYYNPGGGYWRGSIWAPTNYMILRGLTQNGYHDLAHEIGVNHHANVIKTFEETGTVWENYAPESAARGNHSAGEFVGWTGLPPVAVLFEYVFGLRPNVPANTLTWDVRLTDEFGVRQYPFGASGLLDLYCAPRRTTTEKPKVTAHANQPVILDLIWPGGSETTTLMP